MAYIKGTSGDDSIIGTAGNDTIAPLSGLDTVDGAGGLDKLVIDYKLDSIFGAPLMIRGSGSYYGQFDSDISSVNFSNIERFEAIFTSGDDNLNLVSMASIDPAAFKLNGGQGRDTLTLDLTGQTDTRFEVNGNLITSNIGTFSSWELFDITVRGGSYTIKTGNGNDRIATTDGFGSVDGGAGNDFWNVGYQNSRTPIAYTWDGFAKTGTINGNPFRGIESMIVASGLRDDTFSFTGLPYGFGGVSVVAGLGFDTLTVDMAGLSTDVERFNRIGSGSPGHFGGEIDSGVNGGLLFSDIEKVNITFSNSDNTVEYRPYIAKTTDVTNFKLDGGVGNDKFILISSQDPSATNITFAVKGNLAKSNLGTFLNFEQFNITLYGGKNNITTSFGDDTVHIYGGINKVLTGGGSDRVDAYNEGAESSINTIDLGSGNDIANGGLGADTIYGGTGNDSLSGHEGADRLDGGQGSDFLFGGSGADTFQFSVIETSKLYDQIMDFAKGSDKIAIVRAAFAGFAGSSLGALTKADLALGAAATTKAQHLIYNQNTGELWYDADGVGGLHQIKMASITDEQGSHLALSASDFVLI